MGVCVLFSGGKDSTYAVYLAKKLGYNVNCLISVYSENLESYMFHTPSIKQVEKQAKVMKIPLLVVKTKGEKEVELNDLKKAISDAIKKYKIKGIVTGAVESVYQATRVQEICNKLNIECYNPLWQKNQIDILNELIKNRFNVIITGVFAYPLGKADLGKKIDKDFIRDMKILEKKFMINPAGEGGEFESFVLNSPIFIRGLKVKSFIDSGKDYSWNREIEVE
ncbi:diphthine--ammonia ligase [Candidatus Pacearchaeota archaeon]|nr:diphthine--ammonia ligase [Candidatus Pacearchaeota archaeon]